jgi:hypothetical protein
LRIFTRYLLLLNLPIIILYPNGTVNVEVRCSNHPFRLQTEEDRSRVLIFFGQLRQALISILSDSHERIVPNVLEWELTECDINKDVKVSDWFHYTGLKTQVKHMDHLFSVYVKSMGKDTVCRIEERKHPHKPGSTTQVSVLLVSLAAYISGPVDPMGYILTRKPANF